MLHGGSSLVVLCGGKKLSAAGLYIHASLSTQEDQALRISSLDVLNTILIGSCRNVLPPVAKATGQVEKSNGARLKYA